MINAPLLDIGSPLPQYQNAWLTGVSGEAYGPACRWLAQLTTTKLEKASELINFSYPRAPEVLCLDVSFDTDFILPVITRSGQCFFPFQCSVTTCETELSFVLAPEGCSSVWQSPLLWWPCPQRSGAWPLLPLLILALTVPESEEPAFSYHSRLRALLRQTLQYHPQGPGLGKPVALNGIPEGDHPGRWLEGLAWGHRWDRMV